MDLVWVVASSFTPCLLWKGVAGAIVRFMGLPSLQAGFDPAFLGWLVATMQRMRNRLTADHFVRGYRVGSGVDQGAMSHVVLLGFVKYQDNKDPMSYQFLSMKGKKGKLAAIPLWTFSLEVNG